MSIRPPQPDDTPTTEDVRHASPTNPLSGPMVIGSVLVMALIVFAVMAIIGVSG